MSEEYEWLKANYEKGMHLGNFLKRFEEHFGTEFFRDTAPLGVTDLERVPDKISIFRKYLEENLIKGRVPKSKYYSWTKEQDTLLQDKTYSPLEFYEETGVPRSVTALHIRKERIQSMGPTSLEETVSSGTTSKFIEWDPDRLEAVLQSIKYKMEVKDIFTGHNELDWHKDETVFILFFKDEENVEEMFYDRFLKCRTKEQMLEHLQEYQGMLENINYHLPWTLPLNYVRPTKPKTSETQTKRGSKRYEEEL